MDSLLGCVRPDDMRVLVVGCGDGRLAAELKSGTPSRIVWGLERSSALALEAQSRLDRALSGDPEHLLLSSLPHGSFDSVLVDELLGRCQEPVRFLRELKRYLGPRGRVAIRFLNVGHWSVISALLSGESRRPPRLSPSEAREILFDAGYRVIHENRGIDDRPDRVQPLAEAAGRLGLSVLDARTMLECGEVTITAEPLAPVVEPPLDQLGRHELRGVSVVILTYNSARTIEACLRSVLAGLRSQDELIVVDNASRDETVANVRQILGLGGQDTECDGRHLKLICNDSNLGFSVGSNVGIRASRGAYICLLNPDTIVWPGWLERLSEVLHDPTVGMVGPLSDNVVGAQFVGEWIAQGCTLEELPRRCRAEYGGRTVESKLVIGMCAMFRRETLNAVGLLDERMFLGSEDLEMSWRLRTHGLKLMVAQDVFVRHIGGQSFESEDRAKIDRLLFESTEALLDKIKAAYGWRPPDRLLWGFDICHR